MGRPTTPSFDRKRGQSDREPPAGGGVLGTDVVVASPSVRLSPASGLAKLRAPGVPLSIDEPFSSARISATTLCNSGTTAESRPGCSIVGGEENKGVARTANSVPAEADRRSSAFDTGAINERSRLMARGRVSSVLVEPVRGRGGSSSGVVQTVRDGGGTERSRSRDPVLRSTEATPAVTNATNTSGHARRMTRPIRSAHPGGRQQPVPVDQ